MSTELSLQWRSLGFNGTSESRSRSPTTQSLPPLPDLIPIQQESSSKKDTARKSNNNNNLSKINRNLEKSVATQSEIIINGSKYNLKPVIKLKAVPWPQNNSDKKQQQQKGEDTKKDNNKKNTKSSDSDVACSDKKTSLCRKETALQYCCRGK